MPDMIIVYTLTVLHRPAVSYLRVICHIMSLSIHILLVTFLVLLYYVFYVVLRGFLLFRVFFGLPP